MNVLVPHGFVNWALSLNPLMVVGVLLGVAIVLFAANNLVKGRAAAAAGSTRRKKQLEAMATRWQLLLLGATGLVLSLASGYTTWAGMTNFTGESTLSLMVTFGIQGVMLIVAWLIGESFATGMNRRLPDGRPAGRLDSMIGIMLALAVVAIAFYAVLHQTQALTWTKVTGAELNWTRFADVAVYFALGLIVIGVLAFNFARGGELSLPYIQSGRIIIKNAVLWVMFLACMATSVFFSFDSLFTAIFPKEERARAANLRAQNQVAGMVADIGSTIETRRVSEVDHLFTSKGWGEYEKQLGALGQASQGAQRQIEDYFNAQIEDKNRAIKQQQERITSSQSSSAGLANKKTTLTDELARLKGERPSQAADYAEKKTELDNRAKGVDAKRVEAQAEDRGAEGTLKQGKGPMYRQLSGELARLQDAYKIQEERVRDSQRRLGTADTRIAQIERELAAVDGDLAKLKGEAETAEQRIKLTQEQLPGDGTPRVDPARVLPQFERARVEFRQDPTREKLGTLQQQCSQLFGAMIATPATKDRVRSIDCDPKQASEAASVMFALNDGIKAFEAGCAGGDKLNSHKTTDALYGFARKCLSDSGLPSRETDQLRTKINYSELSRDDKAHPFVATLNAFQDGNKLAYLALAIAIAMDTLVFMSGLFGANAVRSPLSDVPSMKARSGRQLDAIIENALLPDTFDNARLVLNAMRPMTARDGFSARVEIPHGDPHADDIRRVLNAASTIGAVRHLEGRGEVYEVRSELFEFLSVVAKRAFESNDENVRVAELRKVMTSALQPHVGDHADIVIHHCSPISERNGFSAEIYLPRLPGDDAFVVQKALNAGATLNYVQLDERDVKEGRYYVHKQLYKTLLMISAAYPKTGQRSQLPRLGGPDQRHSLPGGDITPRAAALGRDPVAPPALPNFVDRMAQAYAERTDEPARQRAPRGASSDELQQYFVGSMIEALGVDSAAYLDMPGDTIGAAYAASEAFKTVQRSNPRLARLIDDAETDAQDAVAGVHDQLVGSREAQTGTGPHMLNAAYEEVSKNLSIISLLPGGPVERRLDSMIEKLEPQHGAGRLNVDEQELLRLIKRLKGQVAASQRNDAESWRRLQLAFSQPAAPHIAIVAQQVKRAGN